MTEFSDRYGPAALVTGASSGIGVGFAEELAARGLDLVLAARRVDRMEALKARLEAAHGITVRILECDLASAEGPQALVKATAGLDIGLVISNAGFGMKGPHEGNDPAAMTDMLMVNANAPMQLARGFLPRLRQRSKGGLVLVASVEGYMGGPYSAAYAASKALVISLGEGLWGEAQGSGVDVLTLCPGATESEAAAKQGVDMSGNPNIQTAREVAALTLGNLDAGPTWCPSDHYRGLFAGMTAMPRKDALLAMAGAMKPKG